MVSDAPSPPCPAVPLTPDSSSLAAVTREADPRIIVVAKLPRVGLCNSIGISAEDAEVYVHLVVLV
jgi:hypothetical protein